MNDKYTKLIETLPKESKKLWFEYNLEVNKIIQENQQLKIQISAREEEYKKFEETNKVLSQELTKDKILKQDHLTNCCGIPIGDIPKLIEKNKELEDNWNKLKAFIVNVIPEEEFVNNEYYVSVLDKMKELEKRCKRC